MRAAIAAAVIVFAVALFSLALVWERRVVRRLMQKQPP